MQRSSTTVPSDEELARRAQEGCATSFEQLMRRFQTPVLQFLRHRGASSDAEDLLQETFVRAYSNLDRYRPKWRFSTWLFTIARRMSINNARRVRPLVDGEAVRSVESAEPEPLERMVAEEDRLGLWDAAARILGREELTAVWLHYVEEMPTREIASVLERSRVSVKTMMFRSRKKLRTLLRDLGPEASPQGSEVSPKRAESVRPAVEVPNA